MYRRIWKDHKKDFYKRNPRFPTEKAVSVGRSLWAITRHKRIKFAEVAQKTGVLEGSILRMSCSHKLTSSPERVKAIAEAMEVDLYEFFRTAREEFFGNFFITKAIMPSDEEVRDYARHGLFLQKQSVLKYPDTETPDFRVIVYSPPVESLDDFFAATFLLSPEKSFTGQLPKSTAIHLAVMNGSIEIKSESGKPATTPSAGREKENLVAGKGAVFNGGVKHQITNLSPDREAEIFIGFAPTLIFMRDTKIKTPKISADGDLDFPALLSQAQLWLSPDPENPIPLSEVALHGGLEARDLMPLSKGNLSNYPLEKMERIAELLHVPIEELFTGQPLHSKLNIEITAGNERGAHDYRMRFGTTFYPWTRLGSGMRKLFMGNATLDTGSQREGGTGELSKEKMWSGKNPGYMLVKGLNGKLGVQAGDRHVYSDIDREDTVYLDMNLGFSFRNFSAAEPANFFLVTNPPIF